MKKATRKLLIGFACAAFCFVLLLFSSPFLLYGGIHMVNDRIAAGIEEELREIPLPEETELADSLSVAGKLSGNGNGMQYYGMLLLSSELEQEELEAYYRTYSKATSVREQKTPYIFDDEYFRLRFSDLQPGKRYFMVWSMASKESSWMKSDWVSMVLDFDLRGH